MNPFYNNEIINNFLKKGAKKDTLVEVLYSLKNKRKDYFNILDNIIDVISKEKKDYLNASEIKNILVNHSNGMFTSNFRSGIEKNLLSFISSSLDKELEKNNDIISNISDVSKSEKIPLVKKYMNKVFEGFTPSLSAIEFFNTMRKQTKVSLNEIELLNAMTENIKTDYKKEELFINKYRKILDDNLDDIINNSKNIYSDVSKDLTLILDDKTSVSSLIEALNIERPIANTKIYTDDLSEAYMNFNKNKTNIIDANKLQGLTSYEKSYAIPEKLKNTPDYKLNKVYKRVAESDLVTIFTNNLKYKDGDDYDYESKGYYYVKGNNDDNLTFEIAKKIKKDILIVNHKGETEFFKGGYHNKEALKDLNIKSYKTISVTSDDFITTGIRKFIDEKIFNSKDTNYNKTSFSNNLNVSNRVELNFKAAKNSGVLMIDELDLTSVDYRDEKHRPLIGSNSLLDELKENKDIKYGDKVNAIKGFIKKGLNNKLKYKLENKKIDSKEARLKSILKFSIGKTFTFERQELKTNGFDLAKITSETINELIEENKIEATIPKKIRLSVVSFLQEEKIGRYDYESKSTEGLSKQIDDIVKEITLGLTKKKYNLIDFNLGEDIKVSDIEFKKYSKIDNSILKDIEPNDYKVILQAIEKGLKDEKTTDVKKFSFVKNIEQHIAELNKLNPKSEKYRNIISNLALDVTQDEIKTYFKNTYLPYDIDSYKNNTTDILYNVMQKASSIAGDEDKTFLKIRELFDKKFQEEKIIVNDFYLLRKIEKVSPPIYKMLREFFYEDSYFDIFTGHTNNMKTENDFDIISSFKNGQDFKTLLKNAIDTEKTIKVDLSGYETLDFKSKVELDKILYNDYGIDLLKETITRNNELSFSADKNSAIISSILEDKVFKSIDTTNNAMKKDDINNIKRLKDKKVFTLSDFDNRNSLLQQIELLTKNIEDKESAEKLIKEMLSSRFLNNPKFNSTMVIEDKHSGVKGTHLVVNTPIIYEEDGKIKYIRTRVATIESNHTSISKAINEEQKKNFSKYDTEVKQKLFNIKEVQNMLGIFIDKANSLTKEFSESAIGIEENLYSKNIYGLEKVFKNPSVSEEVKTNVLYIKAFKGIKSIIYGGIDVEKIKAEKMKNNKIWSLEQFISLNDLSITKIKGLEKIISELKTDKGGVIYDTPIKEIKDVTINNKFDLDFLAKTLKENLDEFKDIDLKDENLFETLKYKTNKIGKSSSDDYNHSKEIKATINYLINSTNTDLQNTAYNELNYYLYTQNQINYNTFENFSNILSHKTFSEFINPMDELNVKILNSSVDNYLFHKIRIGDTNWDSTIGNKQQSLIAGKTFNALLGSMNLGGNFNKEAQRFYQGEDLRSDFSIKKDKTINMLISDYIKSDTSKTTSLKVKSRDILVDAINLEQANAGYKNIFSSSTVYHRVAMGDIGQLMSKSKSISGFKSAFQEGTVISVDLATTSVNTVNTSQTFQLSRLNLNNFNSSFGTNFTNKEDVAVFLKQHPEKINLLLDSKISAGVTNFELLQNVLRNNFDDKGKELSNIDKIKKLYKAEVIADLNKKYAHKELKITTLIDDDTLFNNKIINAKDMAKTKNIIKNINNLTIDRNSQDAVLKHLTKDITRRFFEGDIDHLGYTRILNPYFFDVSDKSKFLKRKAATAFLFNTIKIENSAIKVYGYDIGTVNQGTKGILSSQKSTTSAIYDKIEFTLRDDKKLAISTINNMKVEKRQQIGTKVFSFIETALINIFEADDTQDKHFLKEYISKNQKFFDILETDIKFENSNIYVNFKPITETFGTEITYHQILNYSSENPELLEVYTKRMMKIQKNFIEEYGTKGYGSVDKSDTYFLSVMNKEYETFLSEKSISDEYKIFIRPKNIQFDYSNISEIVSRREGENLELNDIKKSTYNYNSDSDVFMVIRSNYAESAASNSKKKEKGLVINYVMDKLLKISGYNNFGDKIKEYGYSNARKVLVKTIDGLHNEYTVRNIISNDKFLALDINKNILSNNFVNVLDELFTTSVDEESSYIGTKTKKTAVIDLDKVSSDDYILREKENNTTYITELIKHKDVELDNTKTDIMTVTKDSLEYKILEEYKNNNLTDEKIDEFVKIAKKENADFNNILSDIKKSKKALVFESEIGRALVASNIIDKDVSEEVKGNIFIKDNKASIFYENFQRMVDSINSLPEDNDGTKAFDKIIKNFIEYDAEGLSKKVNKGDFSEALFFLQKYEKSLNQIISLDDSSVETLALLENKKNITLMKNVTELIKAGLYGDGETSYSKNYESINTYRNFILNKGIKIDTFELKFALHSVDETQIVISSEYKALERKIKYAGKLKEIDTEISRLQNDISSDERGVTATLSRTMNDIKELGDNVSSKSFNYKMNNLINVLNATEKFWDYNQEDVELKPELPEEVKLIKKNLNELVDDIKVYFDNQEVLLKYQEQLNTLVDKDIDFKSIVNETIDSLKELEQSIKDKGGVIYDTLEENKENKILIEQLENNYNKDLILNKQYASLFELYSKKEKLFLDSIKHNPLTDEFSRKGGALFKEMRYTTKNSRVIMPIEGSLLEKHFTDLLFEKNNNIISGFNDKNFKHLRSFLGDIFVDNNILKNSNPHFNEIDFLNTYIDELKKVKDESFFKSFGVDIKEDFEDTIKNMFNGNDKIDLTNFINKPGMTRQEVMISNLLIENRFAHTMELLFLDKSDVKNLYHKDFMKDMSFYRDVMMFSRHPQQTQFHISGVQAVIIDSSKDLDNPFALVTSKYISSPVKNSAGVVTFGKMTLKLKRGDHDGDKTIVSVLENIKDRNVAAFQYQVFNNLADNDIDFEFYNDKGELKRVSDFQNNFNLIKQELKFLSNIQEDITKENVIEKITDIDKTLQDKIRYTNKVFKFFIHGRIEDELKKHKNVFSILIEKLSSDKGFADEVEAKRQRMINKEISIDDFNDWFKKRFVDITGESDFKLLEKPEFSKFFTESENISIYNKSVNIKNTGIIFEETAKYRLPGTFVMDFDINDFIKENKYLQHNTEIHKKLIDKFKGFNENQLIFTKLADLYYDNANESAISAKHGLSLDALINAKQHIEQTHLDKNLADTSILYAKKIININDFKQDELVSFLETYKHFFADSGEKYEILGNIEKEIVNTFSKNGLPLETRFFYDNNKNVNELFSTELLKLKNTLGDNFVDYFADNFIKNSFNDNFKEVVKSDNIKLITSFLEENKNIFKTDKKDISYEFAGGKPKTVSVDIFNGKLNDIINKTDPSKSSIFESLQESLILLNKKLANQQAMETVTFKADDILKEFKKANSNVHNSSLKNYFFALADLTNVLNQNEKFAEFEIDDINETIEIIKKIDNWNKDKNKLLDFSDINPRGVSSKALYSLNILSSVLADSSNIRGFKEIFEYKIKGDVFLKLEDNIFDLLQKENKFSDIPELKNVIKDIIDNDTIGKSIIKTIDDNIEHNNKDIKKMILFELDDDTRNIIKETEEFKLLEDKDKIYSSIEKAINNKIAYATHKAYNFERDFNKNSSKTLSKAIEFQTALTTNSGSSTPGEFFSDIMQMLRTGINNSLTDSGLFKGTQEAKALSLIMSLRTSKHILQNNGDDIVSYISKNIVEFTDDRLDSLVKFEDYIQKNIYTSDEFKDTNITEMKKIVSNFIQDDSDNVINDFFKKVDVLDYSEKIEELDKLRKEISFFTNLNKGMREKTEYMSDDLINDLKNNIKNNISKIEELEKKINIEEFNLKNINKVLLSDLTKLDEHIEEINKIQKNIFILPIKNIDFDYPRKNFFFDYMGKITNEFDDLGKELPDNPLDLLKFYAKGELHSDFILFSTMKKQIKDMYPKEKLKYHMLYSSVVNLLKNDKLNTLEHKQMILKIKNNPNIIGNFLHEISDSLEKDFKDLPSFIKDFNKATKQASINKFSPYRMKYYVPVVETAIKRTILNDINKDVTKFNLDDFNKVVNKLNDGFIKKYQKAFTKNDIKIDEAMFKRLTQIDSAIELEKSLKSGGNIDNFLKGFKKIHQEISAKSLAISELSSEGEGFIRSVIKQQDFISNAKRFGAAGLTALGALTLIGINKKIFSRTDVTMSEEEIKKLQLEQDDYNINTANGKKADLDIDIRYGQ